MESLIFLFNWISSLFGFLSNLILKSLLFLSDWMIPLTIILIVLYGVLNKVPVFDTFISGARDGFQTVLHIMPTLIGLMIAVGILRASGALDLLASLVQPVAKFVGIPKEALPLTFMRLVSSSASTGLMKDIFKNYGPDSFIGRFVSIMMSSTETVFYTMSVYFLSVKITKTRYTLAGALITNFVGVIASIIITERVFGR